MQTRTAREVADYVGGTLHGDEKVELHTVGSLERAEAGALAYAEAAYLPRVPVTRASCVLVPPGEPPDRTVIVVDRPRVAFARAAQWLLHRDRPAPGVHPTALVAEDVRLADDVHVGAWSLLEAGATVGRGTVIHPGCYVGRGCRIGDGCLLFPHVVLYAATELGDRVTVHAGVVIGADGFGFVFDGERHIKIPQVGHVTIGADVEVGANSCIDRGALDETVIDDGAKIDNLCQIAHNVRIGTHAIISSQTGIAGSSTVGEHATIGGQVGIADYCRIDPRGIVGAQCGVPSRKRVPAGEVYWGTPARPLRRIKTQQFHLNRLPRMAEDLRRLQAEIDELRARLDRGQEAPP